MLKHVRQIPQTVIQTYTERFNKQDEECYQNDIPNRAAADFLQNHIPLMECSDKTLEEIYYFRWWTYRKHIKKTPEGYIITEFLPDVPWAGAYNSINAANAHHIAEGRWLRNGAVYLEDYIRFWLHGTGLSRRYSTWLIAAVWDYCLLHNDFSVGTENLDAMCAYYEQWEDEHLEPCGMFWSIDNFDAMEYTISGTPLTVGTAAFHGGDKGFRPTLNSYMAADAAAISRFARLAGREELADEYHRRAEALRKLINEKLWDGDFFKSFHCLDENGSVSFRPMPKERNVRELIGYVPWCFALPYPGRETAFAYLKRAEGFENRYGMTTAEQNHPRFLFKAQHECLWNGYIWPYATAQTLTAMMQLLHGYDQTVINPHDFYAKLHQYAASQYRTDENGVRKPWIDEVIDPRNGEWYARQVLKDMGWLQQVGGYERGKDYNHSTFCDLVLSGLAGLNPTADGKLIVDPLFAQNDLQYFCVEDVPCLGHTVSVYWDLDGTRYNMGVGLHVFCDDTKVASSHNLAKLVIQL